MADKPSRGLVLYGDGLAPFIEPFHSHLHSLASKASCGFLSLVNSPSSESEDERIVSEFAQLLDATEAYLNTSGLQEKSLRPTISEKFMEMRTAIVANNSSLKYFGGKLGLATLQYNELINNNPTVAEQPVDDVVSGLLRLLGFQDGKALGKSQFDLVFVHIGAGEKEFGEGQKDLTVDAEYINALVGGLMQMAPPGSEIGSRLHLSVVMSYGHVLPEDSSNLSILATQDEKNPDLLKLFPRQSYTIKGEHLREDVRVHGPMLIAQWQYAVTRQDMADKYSFKDFKEHGGSLVIPADRFLHEVAFKLWKAPKYGA